MYGTVQIEAGPKREVVTVPDSAVIDSGTRQVVLVALGEGRFEPRDVKLGTRGEGFVEVLSGVKDGETVVTRANFLIDSESNLKAALSGLQRRQEHARAEAPPGPRAAWARWSRLTSPAAGSRSITTRFPR